ncbi:hypothetical protein IscW_ISCW010134 [Ixodes scapularis]|uniref:Uncharacterized protein n=1 Tax=Ixodes scapularis TaxID=6945 RepID=B7Q264_IXOSC|nr:hypothetical protein IscW_ISCW010134 [Ixodes scapularis]|eukprot:XP_002410517.1 hypothetical protein IscW_ISCW010134 [Ixodes scapularis]
MKEEGNFSYGLHKEKKKYLGAGGYMRSVSDTTQCKYSSLETASRLGSGPCTRR